MLIQTLSDEEKVLWHKLLNEVTAEEIIQMHTAAPADKKPSPQAAKVRALATQLQPIRALAISAPVLILKTYSVYPPIGAQLTDSNGNINLTTASAVKFVMKGITSNTIITGAATVVTPATGIVSYLWGATDTIQADSYAVEWMATWPGGPPTQNQIIPNAAAANQIIEIDADLDSSIG